MVFFPVLAAVALCFFAFGTGYIWGEAASGKTIAGLKARALDAEDKLDRQIEVASAERGMCQTARNRVAEVVAELAAAQRQRQVAQSREVEMTEDLQRLRDGMKHLLDDRG